MNKPIKAKNLPLFSIIDLDQLRREKHLEGTEVTDFFTARDGKVYLLMEQPSETQGKDWLSTPSTYTAVEIQLDWAEQRFAASIETQGLLPQSRLYVHLSPDPETAEKVGQRHGKPVIYLVDAGQMHRDGYLFYLSANGVWLTKVVPAPYLKRLEE